MLEVTPVSVDEWRLLKAVRLQALADAPNSFSTTFAQAKAWSDEEWQERARRFTRSPPANAWIASVDSAPPCGMISCYLSERQSQAEETAAELTAFWVALERRGQGVGQALVACAADWARTQGVTMLQAQVMERNRRVCAFFSRVGFQETVCRQPHGDEPPQNILLLARRLTPPAADGEAQACEMGVLT